MKICNININMLNMLKSFAQDPRDRRHQVGKVKNNSIIHKKKHNNSAGNTVEKSIKKNGKLKINKCKLSEENNLKLSKQKYNLFLKKDGTLPTKYVEKEDDNIIIDFEHDIREVIDQKKFEYTNYSNNPSILLDHYMFHNVVIFITNNFKEENKLRKIRKKCSKKYETEPLIVNLNTHPQGEIIQKELEKKYTKKNLYVVVNNKHNSV